MQRIVKTTMIEMKLHLMFATPLKHYEVLSCAIKRCSEIHSVPRLWSHTNYHIIIYLNYKIKYRENCFNNDGIFPITLTI